MTPREYKDLRRARIYADNDWNDRPETAFYVIPRSLRAQVLKIGIKSLLDDATPEMEGKQS